MSAVAYKMDREPHIETIMHILASIDRIEFEQSDRNEIEAQAMQLIDAYKQVKRKNSGVMNSWPLVSGRDLKMQQIATQNLLQSALEAIKTLTAIIEQQKPNNCKKKSSTAKKSRNENMPNDIACYNCMKSHTIYRCVDLLKLPVNRRIERIAQLKLCANCFSQNHRADSMSCKSGICRRCNEGRHNSILCRRP